MLVGGEELSWGVPARRQNRGGELECSMVMGGSSDIHWPKARRGEEVGVSQPCVGGKKKKDMGF